MIPFAIFIAFIPLMNPLGMFSDLRLKSFDTFQNLFPRSALEGDPVVVIDIDDESLNIHGQWPWPRTLVARLVDRTVYSAATGFDIVFAEPDRTGARELSKLYEDNPELVNTNPYDKGWIVKIKIKDFVQLDSLMNEEEYLSLIK